MSSLFLPFHPLIRHPRYRNTQIQTQTEKQTDGRTDSHVSTRAHSYLLINIHPSTQERLLHSGLQLYLVLSSLYTSLLYHLLYHYLNLLLVCLPTPLSLDSIPSLVSFLPIAVHVALKMWSSQCSAAVCDVLLLRTEVMLCFRLPRS